MGYAASGWSMLIQILLVPLYMRLLGVEAYGLVGFYLTIQAVFQILDLGFTPALNRELARRTARGDTEPGTRDLLWTVEGIYWALGIVIGLGIALGSSFIATRWLNGTKSIPTSQLEMAVALMGLLFCFQWPISLYAGGLLGLQKQALAATVNVSVSTFFGLTVIPLLFVWPNVSTFFVWRAFSLLVQTLVLRRLLWSSLSSEDAHRPKFGLASLAGLWQFSLSMTGISVTAIALTQIDKIVLSKFLSLELFGYYMLATTASSLLPQLVNPIFTATFPMLSQSVVVSDTEAQKRQFHISAQLITVVVYPIAATLALFSEDIILLWTANTTAAHSAGPVLRVMALGAVLNSTMVTPYALQLAHGWTKITIVFNAIVVPLMLPLAIVVTRRWETVGAASTYVIFNFVQLVLVAPMIFRKLLPGQGLTWLLADLAKPLGAALLGTLVVHYLSPPTGSRLLLVAKLSSAVILGYAAAMMAAPLVRGRALAALAAFRRAA
jgi:O-antigen/teichoic acid export membrane protein